jgi:hypothetical protein
MRRLLGKTVARTGVSVLLTLATACGALAYFSTTGAGTASGGVTVLTPSTISSATAGAGAVTLSWSAAAAPGSGTVSYYVSRDGGAPEGNCPTSTSTSTVTTCTDSGVSVGLHHYTVTAVWRTWTATSTSASATVIFGAATHFILTATSTTPTAGVADNLTIAAKDESNNTVATYTGSHNLTFGGASAIGSFNPTVSSSAGVVTNFGNPTAITFTNGVATVSGANNGVMKLYKAETASVTVSDGSIGNGAGLSVTVAAAAAAASFSLVAASVTPSAGEADNLTVTALDAFGNVAVSYTGSHNLIFGGANASPGGNHPTVSNSTGTAVNFGTNTAITFASGVAAVASANNGVMKLYNPEAAKVTVASGTVNNGTGLTVTVSFAAASSLSLTAASVTPAVGASDGLTVTAKDAYGNPITTYTGSHSLTFGGASAIGAFTPTVTNSSGTATNFGTATAIAFTSGVATVSGSSNGVMVLYKVEAAKVTVTDGTLSNGAGLTVTASPGAAVSLLLSAVSTTPTAGVADNLTITAKDTYGNTAPTYTGSHNLTFEDANPIGSFNPAVSSSAGVVTNFGNPTAITFTNGVATVSGANNGVMKLYKAETALVSVSDGSIENGAGLSVTVAAAAASSFALEAASTAPTAGEADNLTVTAFDAFGNLAVSYTGSHNLTFGGANASPGGNHPTVTKSTGAAVNFGTATAITFASGIATVAGANNGVMKLYNAEAAKVTVVSGTVNNGGGLSVTVADAAASSLGLTAASVTPAVGEADNLTVTAKDAYGNTITTYTGSHSLTFGGASAIGAFTSTVTNGSGTATSFGTATAIAFTSGVATVSGSSNGVMVLYKAEAAKVTVTDGTLSNGAGLTVTASPGAAASLSLTATTTTPTAGVADNLTITAKDTYGNTATTYTGSHNLTFGGASAIGSFNPIVSSSTGTVTSFGTVTAITFTNGVATVSGSNNGVMKLYKTETALVTVTDGTLTNGAGLSVTVAAAAAASFALEAASVAPTAGEADNLTVTAFDAFGNLAVSYTGSHNLTFGGANASPGGNHPTVTKSTGAAVNFGTATAIVFASGVATVAGANNGVMKLYNAETAKITVVEGAINNGGGLTVAVGAGAPAHLAWTHVVASAGTLSSPCLFTCTVTTLGNSGTFTANVSVTDSSGNTVSGLGAGHTVTVSTPASGGGSGGSFTEPTAGTSVNLTIGSAGTADSTAQFTFKAQSGVWVSDTMTAQTLAGTVYTNATATLNK